MKKALFAIFLCFVMVFAASSLALAAKSDDYANIELGEMWDVDESLYTWKVNAELGGQNNLPAVVLGATGGNTGVTNHSEELVKALTSTTFVKPNNLILAFSDGFGPNAITLVEEYVDDLIMNEMPYAGTSKTNCLNDKTLKDNVTTDSAAGGTALATGYKTAYSYIGLDVHGNPIPSITEVLREKFGKIIGVVTTDWAYDATPATFGGGHSVRGEARTGETMGQFRPDLWIGVGVDDYSPMNYVEEGEDVYLANNWAEAEANYDHDKLWVNLPQIKDTTGFSKENMNNDCCIYNYFNYDTIKNSGNATISMMTAFSLKWLQDRSTENDNSGFFLMFENTGTDMAGHANELDWYVVETRATDEMVAICLKFACENPDTLVVMTADHETGGVLLRKGWEDDASKIKFSSSGHSKQDVPVYALGYEEYAKLFANQKMLNAQVGKLLAYTMGITENYGMPVDEYGEKYSIEEILAGTYGKEETTTAPADDTKYLDGKVLGVMAKDAATEIKFTLPNMTTAAHAMMTVAVKAPAGATHLTITDNTDAANKLVDQDLNGENNYLADQGVYFFSIKAQADMDKITLTFTGNFAKGDEVLVDYITVGPTINTMDNFDAATVENCSGFASVHDVSEAGKLPAEGNTGTGSENNDKSGKNDIILPIVVCVGAVILIAAFVVIILSVGKKKS